MPTSFWSTKRPSAKGHALSWSEWPHYRRQSETFVCSPMKVPCSISCNERSCSSWKPAVFPLSTDPWAQNVAELGGKSGVFWSIYSKLLDSIAAHDCPRMRVRALFTHSMALLPPALYLRSTRLRVARRSAIQERIRGSAPAACVAAAVHAVAAARRVLFAAHILAKPFVATYIADGSRTAS